MSTIDNIVSVETIAVIGRTEIVRVSVAATETDGSEWGDVFAEPARVQYTTRVVGGGADFGDWDASISAEELIAWAITNQHLRSNPDLLVDKAMDMVLPMFPRLRKGLGGYVLAGDA